LPRDLTGTSDAGPKLANIPLTTPVSRDFRNPQAVAMVAENAISLPP